MNTKLKKWGNSLGVRLPKRILKEVNLEENSAVEVVSSNGVLKIIPLEKEETLEELVKQINKKNLHDEEDLSIIGNEVW